MRRILASTLAFVLPAIVMLTIPARAADVERLSAPILVQSAGIQWGTGPKSLPAGAELAILEGDLNKKEPYTFRLRFPDGYSVAPHSHPVREHITVLSGTLMMGMGDFVHRQAAKPMERGAFFVLPVGATHYVWTEGETVVQLHGTGPWGIDYVNPADDPRNAANR